MTGFPIGPELSELLQAIRAAGGRPLIVGGAVRDSVMGLGPTKDVDIEAFQLPAPALEAALAARFSVDAVGRSFGVLKVRVRELVFDVSLPRAEAKAGQGHRGFLVTPEPGLTFEQAAARRDFTMNAMAWDPERGALVDPFGGAGDIAARLLRHVGPAFAEDPLRVLSACQFAARFGLQIHPSTAALCRSLAPELATLPKERIWDEWKKLLLKSPRPSLGLFALLETGALSLFPELSALRGVQQDPRPHPEGDVWQHTGMVLDSAVRVCADDGLADDGERLLVLLGALCHDLGKAAATQDEEGRWRAPDHEAHGEPSARSLLGRMGAPHDVVEEVVPLVILHMEPFHMAEGAARLRPAPAVRRLALRVPIARLCQVARADFLGRSAPEALACADSRVVPGPAWLLAQAETLQVARSAPVRLLLGRHLIALGEEPGPGRGRLLDEAFEAQLDGLFGDEAGAVAWARARLERAGGG
jgi:tRNA nucleotidyltransferase (CCA-adding enzyme)